MPDPNDRPSLQFPSKEPEPLFAVGKESYKEIAQSLLISMQSARSIENGVTAFMPLANDEARDVLQRIQGHAEQIHKLTNSLYQQIARPAFQ